MKYSKLLYLFSLIILLCACVFVTDAFGLSAEIPEISAGVYACSGHEYGLLAFAGCLELRPDGRFIFKEQQGHFSYDPEESIVEFDDESVLAQAEILEDGQLLLVDLKEGQQLAHAESGFMQCTLVEADACPGW